jgi:hypothetical protein
MEEHGKLCYRFMCIKKWILRSYRTEKFITEVQNLFALYSYVFKYDNNKLEDYFLLGCDTV